MCAVFITSWEIVTGSQPALEKSPGYVGLRFQRGRKKYEVAKSLWWPLALRIRKLIIINNFKRRKNTCTFVLEKSILQRENQQKKVCKSRSLCHLVTLMTLELAWLTLVSVKTGITLSYPTTKQSLGDFANPPGVRTKVAPYSYIRNCNSFTCSTLLSSRDYLVMPNSQWG